MTHPERIKEMETFFFVSLYVSDFFDTAEKILKDSFEDNTVTNDQHRRLFMAFSDRTTRHFLRNNQFPEEVGKRFSEIAKLYEYKEEL